MNTDSSTTAKSIENSTATDPADTALRFATPPAWTATVMENFTDFLIDHAAAEKKAAGMALSMISHYPDRKALVEAMAELAVEEMNHYREVIKWLHRRDAQLGADTKDPYVNQVRASIRQGSDVYLLDRLLTGGIIEARGYERFSLVEQALEPGPLKKFYHAIARSEHRHYSDFIALAELYFDAEVVASRVDELLDIEAAIVRELPIRAALH